jgi:hypothetical protein
MLVFKNVEASLNVDGHAFSRPDLLSERTEVPCSYSSPSITASGLLCDFPQKLGDTEVFRFVHAQVHSRYVRTLRR